jgi:hypothetical protein
MSNESIFDGLSQKDILHTGNFLKSITAKVALQLGNVTVHDLKLHSMSTDKNKFYYIQLSTGVVITAVLSKNDDGIFNTFSLYVIPADKDYFGDNLFKSTIYVTTHTLTQADRENLDDVCASISQVIALLLTETSHLTVPITKSIEKLEREIHALPASKLAGQEDILEDMACDLLIFIESYSN